MTKKSYRIKFKTYTLYAIDRVTGEYIFILSVNANSLKSAKEYARTKVLELNRRYPHYHYSFIWEQD